MTVKIKMSEALCEKIAKDEKLYREFNNMKDSEKIEFINLLEKKESLSD